LATALVRSPPRTALLITLTTETALAVEVDRVVQVMVTVPGASPRRVWPAALMAAGEWPPVVERVTPVGPCLGYVLWLGAWPELVRLLAWDFRSAPVHATDAQVEAWLARLRGIGARTQAPNSPGWHARQAREVALMEMEPSERRAVLREVMADELVDPARRRLALRGLLQAGAPPFWDAGGTEAPLGTLQRPDATLRAQRPDHTTVSQGAPQARGEQGQRRPRVPVVHEPFDETMHTIMDESTAALLPTSLPDRVSAHIEKMIHARTAGLQGREREALQHRLRAQAQDVDFRRYCADRGLPYRAMRRAAARGWQRLKKM
jgi:hypothetical protein